jgi:hypothetical protein
MFRRLIASSPREVRTWCAYALILLAPGSFFVLPLLWLVRLWGGSGVVALARKPSGAGLRSLKYRGKEKPYR